MVGDNIDISEKVLQMFVFCGSLFKLQESPYTCEFSGA